jgi:UDP:flavonoid glycosyltransferase YjiC (YdhE family)
LNTDIIHEKPFSAIVLGDDERCVAITETFDRINHAVATGHGRRLREFHGKAQKRQSGETRHQK